MTFGGSLLLIAVGAILRYGITASVSGVNIDEIGLILMIIGAIGFVIALVYALFWAGEQSRWNRYWGRRGYGPGYGPNDPTRTY